jgi:hypothetical protein
MADIMEEECKKERIKRERTQGELPPEETPLLPFL